MTTTEPFMALLINEASFTYQIFLVNPTDNHFSSVIMETGGFFTDDFDHLVSASQHTKELGKLPARGILFVEGNSCEEFEITVWFYFRFKEDASNSRLFYCSIQKYAAGYKEKKELIPILNKEGMMIELKRKIKP